MLCDNSWSKQKASAMVFTVCTILLALLVLSIAQKSHQILADTGSTTSISAQDIHSAHDPGLIRDNYEKWDKLAWHYNYTQSDEKNIQELQIWWCDAVQNTDIPAKIDTYCSINSDNNNNNNTAADFESLMKFYEYYGDIILLKTAWSHSSPLSIFQHNISEHNIRDWIFTAYQATIAVPVKGK